MKNFLSLVLFVFSYFTTNAQCSCTDCPVPIISNQTTVSELNISGSINDQMGSNDQGLCQVCVNFVHDAPNEVDFFLMSPSGTTVQLIEFTGLNVNQNVTFNICFVSCALPAMPDPGFSAIFDSSEPWNSNATYTGTYYPSIGCLENITGDVNGNWTLTMTDNIGQDDGTMLDWNLVFADDAGLGCGGGSCTPPPPCDAIAGSITASPQPACPGELVNFSTTGQQTLPGFSNMMIVTDNTGMILEITSGSSGSTTLTSCGVLTAYSYNYDPATGATVPTVGSNISQIDCNTGVECCDLVNIPISFNDIIPPDFINAPQNETIACIDQLNPGPQLAWTDNCSIGGPEMVLESGNPNVCDGGIIVRSWQAIDDCGNVTTHDQIITIDPAPIAQFVNPPDDITITCEQVPVFADQLQFSNFETGACGINGFTDGQITGSYNECGGSLIFSWTDFDFCGRPLTHLQNVTVSPAPNPVYIDPPDDITLSCEDVPDVFPDLFYNNFLTGCEEAFGSVSPMVSDNTNGCVGDIILLWDYTNNCGFNLFHIQTISVLPPSPPFFINPPMDVTLDCNESFPVPSDLTYSNNVMGTCELSGTSMPVVVQISPLVQEVTWSFTNSCTGVLTEHTQTLTQSLGPDISINPNSLNLCEGDVYDLGAITIVDANSTNPSISFHSDTPSNLGNELPSSMVTPISDTIFYILATDQNNCVSEIAFPITIDSAPHAGSNGDAAICFENSSGIDLFSILQDNPDTGGSWNDDNASGIDLSNPSNISLVGLNTGTYNFTYTIGANGSCTFSTATVTLNLAEPLTIDVSQVQCAIDLLTYEVTVGTHGYTITASSGTITNIATDEILIENILTSNNLILTIENSNLTNCSTTMQVDAPDCNCPIVNAPVSDGNQVICFGEANPTLSVSSAAGQLVNWFDQATGGTMILANSSSYVPSETAPGIYQFYAEAENIADGCVSAVRTLVQLTIFDLPAADNASLSQCDDNMDGFVNFDLSGLIQDINSATNVTVEFYETLTDAQGQLNPVGNNYTNTTVGTQTIFATVVDQNSCTFVATVSLTVNPNPVFNIDLTHETCFNASDGTAVFSSTDTYEYSLDGITYSTNNSTMDLAPGNYTVYAQSNNSCISQQNFEIFQGVNLSFINFLNTCDDNGTSTDPGDDIYTISFIVTNATGQSGQFELSDDNGPIGIYNYEETITLSYPANGQVINFSAMDQLNNCFATISSPTLISCSTNCELNIISLNADCNDNGTPLDATDDFYTISLEANVVNSASTTYEIQSAAAGIGNFNYGEIISFTLPADGSSPILTLTDILDNQCAVSQQIGPLNPCSNSCALNIVILNNNCNDNGTLLDPSDDFYTIELQATGINSTSTSFTAEVEGVTIGTFNYDELFSFTLPADGTSPILTLTDILDNQCLTSQQISPLNPCSNNCALNIVSLISNCNDNSTPSDPSDDFYTIELQATAINSASTSFVAEVGGVIIGTFNYDELVNFTLPADGTSPILILTDTQDNLCTISQQFGALNTCSGTCILQANISNIVCDNAGTGPDDTDDLFFFDLSVTAINGGSGWQDLTLGISGNYGQTITFGPYLISGGNLNLALIDSNDPSCSTNLVVLAPANCSSCTGTVEAGLDATINCANPSILLTGSANEVGQFSWIDSDGNVISNDNSVTATGEGWYYFNGIFDDACTAIDSLFVTANGALPSANAGTDQILTCSQTSVTIDGSSIPPNPNYQYTWLNGLGDTISSTAILQTSEAAIYTLYIEDNQNGCISAGDDMEVTVDTLSPAANINTDPGTVLNCVIDSVNLSTTAEPNIIYTWLVNGENFVTDQITVNGPGTITLTAFNSLTGCDNQNQISINDFTAYPLISIDPPTILSCNNPIITIDASNSQSGPNIDYTWYDEFGNIISGENDNTLTVENGGFYILESIDNTNNCLNTDTVFVDNLFQVPQSAPPMDISLPCLETEAILNIDLLSPLSDVSITWTTTSGTILSGQSSPNPMVSGLGTYVVQIQDNLSGCILSDSLELSNNPNVPTAAIVEARDESCLEQNNGSVSILGISGGAAPYNYNLSNGLSNQTGEFNQLSPGGYSLNIVDVNGCSVDTNFVINPGVELDLNLPPTIELLENTPGLLEAILNIPEDQIQSISWDPSEDLSCPDCLITQITTDEGGDYRVTVIHENGCLATATIRILLRNKSSIYIPNVFSPDGDGSNDFFTVFANEGVELIQSMMIFDRWGALVFSNENFEPNDLSFGWNGKHRGKFLNPAVFVYTFELLYKDGKTQRFSGDLTLIR